LGCVCEVDVPDNSTREEILEAAAKKFEKEGPLNTEYNRTLDRDQWKIETVAGDYL